MAKKFDYDIFISYSSRDKAWVRGELLKRIEQAGLRAFIDFRDFTRGAPSIKERERGVVKCRKTLIVLTPDYIESEWCEFEGVMAQSLSPANRNLRLIPLLKAECEKPLRIGALTHIDFTDSADLNLARRLLLTALGKPPEPEPPKEPQRDEWFLAHPFPMPPNFTGRLAERAMLNLGRTGPPIVPGSMGRPAGAPQNGATQHTAKNRVPGRRGVNARGAELARLPGLPASGRCALRAGPRCGC